MNRQQLMMVPLTAALIASVSSIGMIAIGQQIAGIVTFGLAFLCVILAPDVAGLFPGRDVYE